MSRAQQLASRRAVLITECSLQRITLSAQGRTMRHATGWLDNGLGLFERAKQTPPWLLGVLAGFVILKPGRAIGLIRNGVMLWQMWRNIAGVIKLKDQP